MEKAAILMMKPRREAKPLLVSKVISSFQETCSLVQQVLTVLVNELGGSDALLLGTVQRHNGVGRHDILHLLAQGLYIAVIEVFLCAADNAGGVVPPLHLIQNAAVGDQLGQTNLFLLRGCLQTVVGGTKDILTAINTIKANIVNRDKYLVIGSL